MPAFSPSSQSCLIVNEHSSFFLETNPQGMSLSSTSSDLLLFELKEPILLAQGIAEGENQIHIAYLKATGELCYSIISTTGEHQTTTLGKLDTRTYRYDRLILLPVDKVIHIFYATSHLALPDVWRVTHLFWNGQIWRSAQLGEVVHPRHPLYHVLIDSKSNLHVFMMTFLGNRSVLMSSFFNGSFHVWSKRQEILNIPREVIDMAVLLTPQNTGYIFWAAKQPGIDKFEVGFASQPRVYDFTSAWQIEANPAINVTGPWKGLGAIHTEGALNLLINADQARLLQFKNQNWSFASSLPSQRSPLQIVQKTESVINYTTWLSTDANTSTPLFAREIGLPVISPAPIPEEPLETPPSPLSSDELITPVSTMEILPEIETLREAPQSYENAPDNSETKEALVSLINGIQETTSSLTGELQALGEKVDPISEVLEALMKKNEETLEALRLLEERVSLKIEREIAIKKGFWARWFT